MTGFRRISGPFAGLFAFTAVFFLAGAGVGSAQENLDLGKSPAQLFASDCAICHKNPRGLSQAGGIFGVESFLREHYTASRQSAAAIAAYLNGIDAAQPPAERRRSVRTRKQEPKAAGDKKPAESRSSDKPSNKPADKPADSKPSGDKGTQASASAPESKPQAKPETKGESKSESKPESKPEAKPAPDKKPD